LEFGVAPHAQQTIPGDYNWSASRSELLAGGDQSAGTAVTLDIDRSMEYLSSAEAYLFGTFLAYYRFHFVTWFDARLFEQRGLTTMVDDPNQASLDN
jgi:hypothetical protein